MVTRAGWMVVGIAFAAAVVWWLLSRSDGAVAPSVGVVSATPSASAPPEMDAVDLQSGASTIDDGAMRRLRVEAPAGSHEPASASTEAVMSGRCIDEQGAPLAGVTIELHGWGANRARLAAYRQEHGEVVWQDPEAVVTQADGLFEVRFEPPPPYQFTLNLEYPGLVRMGGRWGEIEPGAVKDLGDVVLARGALVSGRVVDVDGVPQQGVEVRLNRYNRPDAWRAEIRPQRGGDAKTAADGSFRMSEPLAPATWDLDLRNAQLAEARAEVEISLPATTLELVVLRAADVQRIRGIVVDESGQPVRSAQIDPVGRWGGGWMTNSQRDGTFDLRRREPGDPDGPFALEVDHEQYELLTTTERYDWGAEHVRLVLRRGIDLHVDVTRADDGSPGEEFALRALPKPGSTRGWSSSFDRVRGGWEHEGGRAVAEGLRRGPVLVVVEPRSGLGLMRSSPVEVEVRDGMVATLAVQLESSVEQAVRVLRSDGSAVVGAQVELVEVGAGDELRLDTAVAAPGKWGWLHRETSTLVDKANTDAAGDCALSCAADREYSLRVTGEGHVPIIRRGVRPGAGVIELVVPLGGTVVVTLQPPELVADLRELALLGREGAVEAREQRKLPGVQLVRQVGDRSEAHPPSARVSVPFDAQGRATIAGIPAGTWDLQLASTLAYDSTSYSTSSEVVRAGLVVEEGAELQVALQLPEMRTGRIVGTVTVNGEPFVGVVQFEGSCGPLPDGQVRARHRNAKTDAAGAFEIPVLPGTWQASAWIPIGNFGFSARASGAIAVVSGQTARVAIDVPRVLARVRLLSPAGQPVAGARLAFERDGAALGAIGEPTDADGYTTLTTTAGAAIPRLWIRSLQSQESQREFWQANHSDAAAIERAQVSLAPVEFGGPAERVIELRLPAEWDR